MIDSRLLSVLTVYETGSFTRAAERLSLSQPAVSQHVRQLENELHVHIFERVRGTLRVTREGEIIVKYARRMQALTNNMQEALASERTQVANLTVGITHTAESNFIAATLARYVSLRDGMSIKMITATVSELFEALKNYELDFALVEGRINDTSLNHILLDTDCLVLAVSPQHKLASKSTITINDLKKEKLILRLPNSNTRNLFSTSLESQNLSIDDFNIIRLREIPINRLIINTAF